MVLVFIGIGSSIIKSRYKHYCTHRNNDCCQRFEAI